MSILGSREPAVVAGAIRAVLLAAVSFGLDWTPEQIGSLMLAVEAVLTVLTRQTVTSPATLARVTPARGQS